MAIFDPAPDIPRNDDITVDVNDSMEDGLTLSPDELRSILKLKSQNNFSEFPENRTLGLGGTGAVFAVQDPQLNRMVAMKVLRPKHRNEIRYLDGLIREARITAQIDHPNIIPVYQIGILNDAGAYFSMKLVEGENLRSVLKKLEAGDEEYIERYSLNTLLDIFISICNAISFAHSKGILHRDLKSSNIMLGAFGETLVMDWGMAKYRVERDSAEYGQKIDLSSEIAEQVSEENITQFDTMDGCLHGTPAFMAPEQAMGLNDEVDERTDIYGLGAILYCMLTWERSPFDPDLSVNQILKLASSGEVVRPRKRAPKRKIPFELEAICRKAMAKNQEDRYLTVAELISDIRAFRELRPVVAFSKRRPYKWAKYIHRNPMILNGAIVFLFGVIGVLMVLAVSFQMRGRSILEVAEKSISSTHVMLGELTNLTNKYNSQLLNPDISDEDLTRIATEQEELLLEVESRYQIALETLSQVEGTGAYPDKVADYRLEILENLLEYYLKSGKNQQAVRSLVLNTASRYPDLMLQMNDEVPDLMERVNKVVTGVQSITINQEYEDDEFKLFMINPVANQKSSREGFIRFESSNNQLDKSSDLVQLRTGDYLISLTSKEGQRFNYPIRVRPNVEQNVLLTRPKYIPDGMVYIPAGEFMFGTEVGMDGYRKATLPDYFIGKNEVTFGEYLKFWQGLESENMRELYNPVFKHNALDREFHSVFNDDGTINYPYSKEMPVTGISLDATRAYCRWLSEELGMVVRLPNALEWEKAARGVDGRRYVWGNNFMADFSLSADNPLCVWYPNGSRVGAFPDDISIYGVEDMGGNVREFIQPTSLTGTTSPVRGGSFRTDKNYLNTYHQSTSLGLEDDVGFRILMERDKRKEI